jgi:hypothetical protein
MLWQMLTLADLTEEARRARWSMVRSLVFYFAVATACVVAAVYIYALPPGGFGWVSLVIVTVLSLLAWWQVWQFGRDMWSQPVEKRGQLAKKWQRAELFLVWQSYFVLVDRAVFKLEPEQWVYLQESDAVQAWHFPRTFTVVSFQKVDPVRTDP